MPVKPLRLVLSAWVALAPYLLVQRTAAADPLSSCVFSMTDVAFGSVNVLPGTAVTSSGLLSVRCPTLATILGSTLYACITFPAPRTLAGPSSATLAYDLYGPSPSTGSWSNTTPVQFPISLLLNGGTASIPVSAALLAGQATAPPGSYVGTKTATVAFGLLGCASGAFYTTSFVFSVRATVINSCTISASNIAFGPLGLFASDIDAQGQVVAQCTSGTSYSLGLDGGVSAAANPALRQMQSVSGSGAVTYGLYRNAARTLPWGNTAGSNVLAGTGTASTQVFPTYARIPAQATPAPGTYSDTVVVTVTY